MSQAKPIVLTRQPWGKRVEVKVKVDSGDELRHEIRVFRKILRSSALNEAFVLIAKGMASPGEIAHATGKSKFAVSLQLSALRKVGLLKPCTIVASDMRRKRYEIVWTKVAEIFRQDHALELEIYENHLAVAPLKEVEGTVTRSALAVAGNGKLGLIREVVPQQARPSDGREVEDRDSQIRWEFVELFKAYLKERRFTTLREYFLGIYEELSEHYGRLPRTSELARFFEFTDRAFLRSAPIETIWRKYVTKRPKSYLSPHKQKLKSELRIKLFTEAGSLDPAGRYVLNAEAQAVIKPGTPLRIYPSYAFGER